LTGLSRLCEEFHFGELAARLSHFPESDDLKKDVTLKDLEARKPLSALEERMQQRDREIVALQVPLSRHLRMPESSSEALLGRVALLEAEVSALQTAPAFPLAIPRSGSVRPALPLTRWNSVIVSLRVFLFGIHCIQCGGAR
jgi:hypothetical protein